MESPSIQTCFCTNWNPVAAVSYPAYRAREITNVRSVVVNPTSLMTSSFFDIPTNRTMAPRRGKKIVRVSRKSGIIYSGLFEEKPHEDHENSADEHYCVHLGNPRLNITDPLGSNIDYFCRTVYNSVDHTNVNPLPKKTFRQTNSWRDDSCVVYLIDIVFVEQNAMNPRKPPVEICHDFISLQIQYAGSPNRPGGNEDRQRHENIFDCVRLMWGHAKFFVCGFKDRVQPMFKRVASQETLGNPDPAAHN